MPEFKVAVSLSVADYDKSYGPSLESSHHNFFVEAGSAAAAIGMVRDKVARMELVTADVHDRIEAEIKISKEQI